MAKEATTPLLGERQQPSSNEECISVNCKKITGLLILPFIVMVFDAITIYRFSSLSNSIFQTYVIFLMVKAFILFMLCGLFVYAVKHPEKRDILLVGAIIAGLLFIFGLAYIIFILCQCGSMGSCSECYKDGPQECYSEKCPDYNPSISKQCYGSIVFPIFGLIASFFVHYAAIVVYGPE